MASGLPFIRTRLSVMMFLEFLLWASWYVPIGGYMNSTLGFTGSQMGWIYTTTALGAIISPLFVGYVADRLFATERVLGVLHLIGSACLFATAQQTAFAPIMALLVVNALCFMPTLALANSLAFRNIDDPDRFSRIAVWGTIGWIVSGQVVDYVLGGATRPWFLYLAGGGGLAMGVYSFSLPHTPPKGAAEAGGDVLGLGALKLLKDTTFLVFAVSVLLICIPLTFYFTWANAFLVETDRPRPVALMTLCQVSEIVVMIVMPWFIGRIGLKNVLVLGMAAWFLRYLCFASLSFPLILVGLLMHGFCYCFVFVASFIYVDKRAPRDLRASAQSLIAFVMWGVGMFIGAKLAGFTADEYRPETIAAVRQTAQGAEGVVAASLPDWPLEPDKASLPKALGLTDETRISIRSVESLPEDTFAVSVVGSDGKTTTTSYAKRHLVRALEQADADADGAVTRPEWRIVQSHHWPPIWLWPCGLALAVCLLFAAGGRETARADAQEATP